MSIRGTLMATYKLVKTKEKEKDLLRHFLLFRTPEEVQVAREINKNKIQEIVDIQMEEQQIFLNEINASKNIEIGAFNYSITYAMQRRIQPDWMNADFVALYSLVIRDILHDLKISNLFDRIARQEFPPHKVAYMRPTERFEGKWKNYLDKRADRESKMFDVDMSQVTDQFYCKKCHQSKCVYQEKQTRSADEPMTLFISCIVCGNHWRM